MREARGKFFAAVIPFIDYFCAEANCPLHMPQVRVDDERNHASAVDYASPYLEVTINPHTNQIFLETQPVYAMSRKGRNSGSGVQKRTVT